MINSKLFTIVFFTVTLLCCFGEECWSDDYSLTVDDTYTVFRNLRAIELEKNLAWVVMKNGNRVLARRATYDTGFQHETMPGSYEIYLEDNGAKVSNSVEYIIDRVTPLSGSPEQRLQDMSNRYKLEVDDQQCVVRSSFDKSERGLTWIIVKDERIKLERGAEKETKYCNVLNYPGPFKIYLRQFLNDGVYKVSNDVISNADAASR